MKPDAPSRQMFQFLWPGGLIAQAIYVAARLGVADRISEAPRSAADLAGETGSQVDALERVLRALSCVGIFEEDETGRFARNDHESKARLPLKVLSRLDGAGFRKEEQAGGLRPANPPPSRRPAPPCRRARDRGDRPPSSWD